MRDHPFVGRVLARYRHTDGQLGILGLDESPHLWDAFAVLSSARAWRYEVEREQK